MARASPGSIKSKLMISKSSGNESAFPYFWHKIIKLLFLLDSPERMREHFFRDDSIRALDLLINIITPTTKCNSHFLALFCYKPELITPFISHIPFAVVIFYAVHSSSTLYDWFEWNPYFGLCLATLGGWLATKKLTASIYFIQRSDRKNATTKNYSSAINMKFSPPLTLIHALTEGTNMHLSSLKHFLFHGFHLCVLTSMNLRSSSILQVPSRIYWGRGI